MTKKSTSAKYFWRRLAAVLVTLAILAGIVLSLTVFFGIGVIQVKGNLEIYDRDRIISASGLQTGMNLLRFSKAAVSNRIMRTLPYVSGVTIRKALPNRVIIEVTEADNALIMPYAGGILVLSQELDIIKNVSSYEGKALTIKGIRPVDVTEGSRLEDEETVRNENLRMLIDRLAEEKLLTYTTAIDVSDRLNLTVDLQNRIRVVFGTSGEMERKMLMLREMFSNQIGEEEYGVLTLTVAGKATFAPMKEEEFQEKILGILIIHDDPPEPDPEPVPGEEEPPQEDPGTEDEEPEDPEEEWEDPDEEWEDPEEETDEDWEDPEDEGEDSGGEWEDSGEGWDDSDEDWG